jgi:hypothetical protein
VPTALQLQEQSIVQGEEVLLINSFLSTFSTTETRWIATIYLSVECSNCGTVVSSHMSPKVPHCSARPLSCCAHSCVSFLITRLKLETLMLPKQVHGTGW